MSFRSGEWTYRGGEPNDHVGHDPVPDEDTVEPFPTNIKTF